MKKTLLLFMLASIATLFVVSCNSSPKMMTESQIDKKIEQLTAMEVDSLDAVLDMQCQRKMSIMVAAKRDSIIAASEKN